MTSTNSPLGPHRKRMAYVCALALLCSAAIGVIILPWQTHEPQQGNSKPQSAQPMLVATAPNNVRPAVGPQLVENYGKLPLRFEANSGQTDSQVKFLSRGRGYTMFLTGDEAVLSLRRQKSGARGQNRNWKLEDGKSRLGNPTVRIETSRFAVNNPESGVFHPSSLLHGARPLFQNPKSKIQNLPAPSPESPAPEVVRMKLVGANPNAKVTGHDKMPGKSNYFIGNDPKKWRTNVANYAKVKYEGVYPGIDVVYYGTEGGQLEYDFIIAPGADPSVIAFDIVGAGLAPPLGAQQAEPLRIDPAGDLVIATGAGEVRFHKPVVYQDLSTVSSRQSAVTAGPESRAPNTGPSNHQFSIDNRQFFDGRFVLLAENRVGFEAAHYDKTKPLVIDPVLSYSTYLGGSRPDLGTAITVDPSGSAYVAGYTASADFPTLNPLQSGLAEPGVWYDAFFAKLNPEGSALMYSTYLGGSEYDYSQGIAIDGSGNAYVSGITNSPDFPTISQSFDTACGSDSLCDGVNDGFVTKLNADGSALLYSTYLGGSSEDYAWAVAVDPLQNAYVAGQTCSSDFPTTVGVFQTDYTFRCDAFITKLNPEGTVPVYSTFFGGSDTGAFAIAVDTSGNVHLTGSTSFEDLPTATAFQASRGGGVDAFVAKFNPEASQLVYSTYLGGTGTDVGRGIALDASGAAYVTGATLSTDFPATQSAFQTTCAVGDGCHDAFVSKFSPTGTLLYSSYLGGTWSDDGYSIFADATGNAYVTGITYSFDFPLVSPIQSFPSRIDAILSKIEPDGSALVYSTYLGGGALAIMLVMQ